MWHLALTLPLGIVLGLVLAFTHKSIKPRGIPAKIGIGFVAGLGICVVINSIIEMAGYAGGG